MRKRSSLYRLVPWCFALALLLAGAPSAIAEESPKPLSEWTTAELAHRALEIWTQLEPGLEAQAKDSAELKSEIKALLQGLQTTPAELKALRDELARRSTEAETSASEVKQAQAALQTINALVGNSEESWQSSIDAVNQALNQAAQKQRRAEIVAWGAGGVAVAATIWALIETVKASAK
jgi:predicted RNase H-like nuclease (RuvC/YqgF family)